MSVEFKTPFGIWRTPDHTADIWEDFKTRLLPERDKRIARLVEKPRCMTPAAAKTVIDAAMFGIGCIEGDVRKLQEENDANRSQTGE